MPVGSVYPPITLPLNLWLGALTCLINYTQTIDTNTGAFDIPILNETQDINVPNGNGKLLLSADLPDVQDYSKITSLLNVVEPVVAEQYVALSKFKVIPLSVARQFFRLSFLSETDSSSFVGYVLSLMNASKNVYLYTEIVQLISSWVATPFDDKKDISTGKRGQKTSIITIDLWDISTLKDVALINQYLTYNSNIIYNTILNVKANLNSPTRDYNEQGMIEFVNVADLKIFINSYFSNYLTVNTLATLLNSEKITSNENNVNKYLTIPQIMLAPDDQEKVVGWLGHGRKFQWGYFYNLATAFFDSSNLTTNNWLHYSYYMATVDNYPMIKLVANFQAIPTDEPEPKPDPSNINLPIVRLKADLKPISEQIE